MTRKQIQFFSNLERVRRQLERWRRTRKPKERIPQALWNARAQLARRHGISRVARALRLQYDALRDRAEAAPGPKATATPGPFVEVPLRTPRTPAACVVELEDERGWKMTLRLAAAHGADAAALVEAFWRRAG